MLHSEDEMVKMKHNTTKQIKHNNINNIFFSHYTLVKGVKIYNPLLITRMDKSIYCLIDLNC